MTSTSHFDRFQEKPADQPESKKAGSNRTHKSRSASGQPKSEPGGPDAKPKEEGGENEDGAQQRPNQEKQRPNQEPDQPARPAAGPGPSKRGRMPKAGERIVVERSVRLHMEEEPTDDDDELSLDLESTQK